MSLVECRYNPNHRMKPSKREIHEQKCPDRLRCQKKYKHCPYDPLELIEEKDYAKHLLECKSRPKITVEEEEEIERAKTMNDIATEREQIQYARLKYYKDCVEEPEIPGISKNTKKNNKKKVNKNIKKKFVELNQKETDHFAAMADKVDDDEFESHHIDNFTGDKNFDIDFGSKTEEKNNIKSFESSIFKNKDNKEKDKSSNKKDPNKNEINFKNKENLFYIYDPNEEDKDIGKFSANIVNPEEIKRILGLD